MSIPQSPSNSTQSELSTPTPVPTQREQRPRKKRTTPTLERLEMIVRQHNPPNSRSPEEIADIVGMAAVSVRTVLRKARECEKEGRPYSSIIKKKGRKTIQTKANRDFVKEVLTGDRTATLATAKEALEERGVNTSVTTVCRMANDAHISVQKIALRPSVVLTEHHVDQRENYGRAVDQMPDEELWFLDESGFNLHLAPTRCWSEVGHTPVQDVPANRGRNVSLLMCISKDGIEGYVLRDGPFNTESYLDFVNDLAARFPEVANGDVTLVMDNVAFHHSRDVTAFFNDNGIRFMFLPSYSPDLNPIENVFGTIKARFRRGGVVRTTAELGDRIERTIQEVENDLEFQRYFDHMRTYVVKAMNRERFN